MNSYKLNEDGSFDRIPYQDYANGLMNPKRILAVDEIGDYEISTVFLVIDHGFLAEPILFESMIFFTSEGKDPHELDLYQDRYKTMNEALEGHKGLVDMVLSKHKPETKTVSLLEESRSLIAEELEKLNKKYKN